MRHIPPHSLWMGHTAELRELRAIHEAGIQAVVDLAGNELPQEVTRGLVYCRFPLHDDDSNPNWLLHAAVKTLADFIRARIPTLVCCSAGLSRTPAIIAVALSVATGQPREQCLAELCATGPTDVSPGLWNSLGNAVRESGK